MSSVGTKHHEFEQLGYRVIQQWPAYVMAGFLIDLLAEWLPGAPHFPLPISAYLAATPGGLDSVAAVATELQGDTAVILTVHLVRLLCVLMAGPWLVRACARWLTKSGPTQNIERKVTPGISNER